MENASKHSKILFLFLNLVIFLRNSTPEGFAYICQNKWKGITTTQRLSIIFAVIASSDLIVAIGNLFNPLKGSSVQVFDKLNQDDEARESVTDKMH